ncbi:MAG: NmrA/HSCARG family protein [Longimicrobiales bacterium]
MSEKKVIAVVGATGAQGGGLARAILEDEESPFSVRAITRNPSSDQARALANMGAELVQADLDDQASLERAFSGAYGAFCVTNFWEHFSPAKEKAQARNMAEAAKIAGLKHAVWSTFEDTRDWVSLEDDRMPTLQGEYKVPHFDGKGEADAFFEEAAVPTTFLRTSFYWDNFIHFGAGPQRGEGGMLALNLPMGEKKLPGIAAEDIGRAVYGIFRRGSDFVGKTIGVAGEHLTGSQMAEALSDALGEPVRYNAMPFDAYRGLGFPGADDMGNMFQFKHDFQDHYRGARPVEDTRALNPKLQSFRDWLAENKDRIPVD